MISVVPLDPSHREGWAALFEAQGSGCFCRYWHFTGNKNDWLDRCANTPRRNFDDQASRIQAGDEAARGLVAIDDDRASVVGWMKLAPRATLPKLRNLPVYRGLDLGPDDGVYAVGCILVHPQHRGRGIARALVLAADQHVKAWGGRAIEAYPRRCEEQLHAEEAWMGPEAIFRAAGFVPREDPAQMTAYPVYRKAL